jgi:hypothetical protein
MHSLNQVNKLVSCGRDPARSLPLWRGFLLIPLILVCFAFAPQTRALVPAPDGCYPLFNTAEGCNALQFDITGLANTGLGFGSLRFNTAGNLNTGAGAGTLLLNRADNNTAVGGLALLFNGEGSRNTAVGTVALFRNTGNATTMEGFFNGAYGTEALENNTLGFSNNAVGDSALINNVLGAQNTAVGDLALRDNDSNGQGLGNFNTAVGASAMVNNINGDGNTVVGEEAGPNLLAGFNNTYVGQLVGSFDPNGDPLPNEDSTIRIGDLSGGNSQACFIGGIFNNDQPVGENVAVVTLNLLTDQLGVDLGAARSGTAPAVPHRSAPQPRSRPQPRHEAMLNDKVEKLQATVTQQQKQIETLTAQLREQAAQIQNVSAQLEMVRPAPRVVENR